MTVTLELWMAGVAMLVAGLLACRVGWMLSVRGCDFSGFCCRVVGICLLFASWIPPVAQFEWIPAAEAKKAEEPAVISEGAADAKAGVPYGANPYPVPHGVGGDSWKHAAWQRGWREWKRGAK